MICEIVKFNPREIFMLYGTSPLRTTTVSDVQQVDLRVINSYCIQNGCFLVLFWLFVSSGMTINILLSFCAARDMHFSALVVK